MKFYLEVEIDPKDVRFVDMVEWLREVRDKGSELGHVVRAELQEIPPTISFDEEGGQ